VPRGGLQLVRKIKGLQREGRKRKRPSSFALSEARPLIRPACPGYLLGLAQGAMAVSPRY
jgi:hypothetical protein